MKALSLTQPYANFIWRGLKTIETRTWKTNFRGTLLICSTKAKVLNTKGCVIEPRGMALCVVDVIDCRRMERKDEEQACILWRDDLWMWPLVKIRRIKPFPVKGQQRIFNIDCEVELL